MNIDMHKKRHYNLFFQNFVIFFLFYFFFFFTFCGQFGLSGHCDTCIANV